MSEFLSENPAVAALALLVAGGMAMAAILPSPRRGLYAYIFATSVLLTADLPVVGEKLAACDGLFVVTVAAMLAARGRLRTSPVPLLPPQKRALAWGLAWWATAAASLTVNVTQGVIRNETSSALETAVYLYGVVLAWLVVTLCDSWRVWVRALTAYALGALVVVAFGWLGAAPGAPAWLSDEGTGRVSSTLRNSGQVSAYIGPPLVFLLFLQLQPAAPRWFRSPTASTVGAACVLGGFGVLALTGSRMSILIAGGVFVALLYLTVREARRRGVKVKRAYLVLAAGAYAAVSAAGLYTAALNSRSSDEREQAWVRGIRLLTEDGVERAATDPRAEQAKAILEHGPDHPLLGVGPGNWMRYYQMHEIHNTYLSVVGETGLAGTATYLVSVIAALSCVLTARRLCPRGPAGVLVTAFGVGVLVLLFYQLTALGLRQRHYWMVIGFAIAAPRAVIDLRMTHDLRRRAALAAGRAGPDEKPGGAG